MKKPKNEILENAVFTGFQILTDKEIVDDLNGCENEDKEGTETENKCQGASFEALDILVISKKKVLILYYIIIILYYVLLRF